MKLRRAIWAADVFLFVVAAALLLAGKSTGIPADVSPGEAGQAVNVQAFCELSLPQELVDEAVQIGGMDDAVAVAALRAPEVSRGGAVRREESLPCLGTFQITYYCSGACCNGPWSGKTSTGAPPVPWHTIAVDPHVIPLGSHVYIEGYGEFIAEDVGSAVQGKHIDLLVNSHQEATKLGVNQKKIYLIS